MQEFMHVIGKSARDLETNKKNKLNLGMHESVVSATTIVLYVINTNQARRSLNLRLHLHCMLLFTRFQSTQAWAVS